MPLPRDGQKMTAEVAVLNKSAIAVAADSAVTRGQNKVHVTANKIFRISDRAPVGMMVYGNADVFGIPWEVVAKIFRTETGNNTYPSIQIWSDTFISFLKNDRFLSETVPDRELIYLSVSLAERLRRACHSDKPRAFANELQKALDVLLNHIVRNDEIEDYPIPTRLAFSRKYGNLCKEILADGFEGKHVSQKILNQFPELVRRMTKSKFMSDYMSGFTIFGFGDSELFPSLLHFRIDCAPYNQPRIDVAPIRSISREPNADASINAFARSEISTLFMEDVAPKTKRFFLRSMATSLKKFGDKIFDEFVQANKINTEEVKVYSALFRKEVDDFSQKYEEELSNFIFESSVSPIVSALDGLGKEDMAKLAEALVELTSLKFLVSRSTEVVGGPIDVAVLSKTDGFIWIQRKHYFNREYNDHFFQNYLKEKPTFLEGSHETEN